MMVTRRSEASWVDAKSCWRIDVQRDGKRRSFYSSLKGRKGKHEAEAKADAWLQTGGEDLRFPVAWSEFLSDQQKRSGSQNYQKLECTGRLYIAPVIGNTKLSAISPNLWQKCIDSAAEHGLARRSCANVRAVIVSFVRYAQRARWDVVPLLDGDLRIPTSAAPEKPKTILQPQDIRVLFSQETIVKSGREVTAHFIHCWRFIVATGLRRGEAAGLQWSDVTEDTVSVLRSVNSLGEITRGKNDNARRTFALTHLAKRCLDGQRAYLKSLGIISPWVFPDRDGAMALPKAIADGWRFYCNQHGFSTTVHELRHTFVSVGKQDLPLELMKSVVGHSSSMDTYGIYGHDVDGEAQRAAEIIDGVFSHILDE